MALLLLLTVRGHMTVVFCVGHKKLLSCDLAPPKFWMWGVLPRRVLPGRVLALANPHLLEVGSTLTSNPSTTTPPRTLTFLMWVVLPRRVLPPEPSPFGCGEYSPDECSSTSAPSTSAPHWTPQLLDVGVISLRCLGTDHGWGTGLDRGMDLGSEGRAKR